MKKILFAALFILISITLAWSSTNSADSLLNGKWTLQKINGNDVVKEKAGKTMPYLEFHLTDNSLSGNTGCNDLSGKINVNSDEITLSDMSVTKMNCMDAEYEQDIENVVFYKGALKFKIDSGTLYLIKDGKEVMVLKKAE